MNWLRKKDAKSLYAKVFIGNEPSLSNLKKFRFKPVKYILEKELK